MDQVLEHLKYPEPYLKKIHKLLNNQGLLYIGVPNIMSISSHFKTIMGKLGLKKRRGKHYDSWHHIFYYSPSSLRTSLEQYYDFNALETGNDQFILPTIKGFRRTFIETFTRLPFTWRTTFYCIFTKR